MNDEQPRQTSEMPAEQDNGLEGNAGNGAGDNNIEAGTGSVATGVTDNNGNDVDNMDNMGHAMDRARPEAMSYGPEPANEAVEQSEGEVRDAQGPEPIAEGATNN